MSALTLQGFSSLHFSINCSPVQAGMVGAGSTAPQMGAARPGQRARWKQPGPSESLAAPRAGDSHTYEAAGSAGQDRSAGRTGTPRTARSKAGLRCHLPAPEPALRARHGPGTGWAQDGHGPGTGWAQALHRLSEPARSPGAEQSVPARTGASGNKGRNTGTSV